MEPNMPKLKSMAVTFTAAKARFLNRRSGSMGSSIRSSHHTKAARPVRPAAKADSTPVLVHPCELPCTRP